MAAVNLEGSRLPFGTAGQEMAASMGAARGKALAEAEEEMKRAKQA
jgi:hypothetical protein